MLPRVIIIGFTGPGYSELVPPGCDPCRVSLLADIRAGNKHYYICKPLPDAAFTDPSLMNNLRDSLYQEASTKDLTAYDY